MDGVALDMEPSVSSSATACAYAQFSRILGGPPRPDVIAS